MAEEQTRELQLLKIYLKDCSVENPNSPGIFSEQGDTQFSLNVDVTNSPQGDNRHEVVLSISAKAMLGDKTLVLIEVQQAALMQLTGFRDEDLEPLFNVWAPAQIYPFAREVVSSVAGHAGFPQVVLPLINFEQFYEQRKRAQMEGAQPAPVPQGDTH